MKENVRKNYIYNLIYQIVAIIIPIISTPYISRVLDAKNIGIYGYTLSISAYFVLLGTLGITIYGQREIAYLQNNKVKYSKVFWEVFFLRLIVMSFSTLLFFLMFVYRSHDYSTFYRILILELVGNALDISWFFQGLEAFKKIVFRNLLIKIVSVICIFTFIKGKEDLNLYFMIYVLSILLGSMSLWISLPKYITKVSLNKLKLFRHLKPALILFIPQVAIQIYTVLDKTMIGKIISNKTEVGFYTQGENIIKLLLTIITSLGVVMLPRIASKFAEKNYEKIKEYIYKSFNLVFLLSLPMIFGIILIAKSFVPIFFGKGYDGVTQIMVVLCPILMLIGMSNVIGVQYLLPTKHQKEYTLSVIFGAISNFIINLFLIYKFKAVGAAIGTVIAELIVTCTQLFFVRKNFEIKKIFSIFLTYLIPSIIMFICCYFVNGIFESNFINIIMVTIVGIIVYGSLLLLTKNEFVFDYINSVLNAIKNRRN